MAKLVISLFLFLMAAGPALAQAAAPTPPAEAPSPGTSPPSTTAPSGPPTETAPPSAASTNTKFKTQSAAQAHCPGETIVWATMTRARLYHLSGDRVYGRTRRGAYMCQKDADAAGMHVVTHRGRMHSAAPPPPSGSSTSGSSNQ